jgi:TonB family protein
MKTNTRIVAAILAVFTSGAGLAAQGQTLGARDGDLIVVNANAEVRVVRRADAYVRAIFDAAQRSLVLLVDYFGLNGRGPDGRVDATYRFLDVTGEWPLGARWEGPALIEDYSLIGGGLAIQGAGLRTPAGLVQILGGPLGQRSAELFAQTPAAASLSFRNGGRSGGGGSFAQAEAREVQMTGATAERLANPGAAGALPPPTPGLAPVRVGGNIPMPRRIVDAEPVMPDTARQAGITGVVILEIVIGTDGKVSDVKILRSIPLLDQAAIDTAKQWRYEPTQLNGVAVPVIMTATVAFR